MKKRILTLLAVLLLLAAGWIANAFLGNPVSAFLVRRNAREYIRTAYPQMDLRLEDARYSFKDGSYHAFVVSDSSRDTHFTLYYDALGRLFADTYEDRVTSGWNTIRRLDEAYRQITDPVLESLPYDVHIAFGELRHFFEEEEVPGYPAIPLTELEPDKEYDISELGAAYGHLVLYLTVGDTSPGAAAQMLPEIGKHLEVVPFYSLDLTLQKADGGEELYLRNFPAEEIASENLEEKIREYHRMAEESYDRMDKEQPVDQVLQAAFREDGGVTLTCGEESITFAMGSFPEESMPLGAARLEVLSPGAVLAVFGDTDILFLEEGAVSPDITSDLVWGNVTQSHGAHFAIFPQEPSESLRQRLESDGMTLLLPAELGTVTAESAGTEFLLSWSLQASLPAMSAGKAAS